ncbi:MAG: hypothetical protein GWN30_05280 [Gammaproteobacteria bacterium]|nr:hypothetical protein [Gammaproteobacteria bacterium]
MEAELAKVNELKAIDSVLDQRIAYAESDEIVENWARQENWMQKEGDFVIVLIPNGDLPPEPVTEITVPLQKLENWESWRLWLTFQE